MNDPAIANQKSAWLRKQRAVVRAALNQGHVPLSQVMFEPPECVRDLPAWKVIGWVRLVGIHRISILNEQAIGADVNLAKRMGSLSTRERAWIVEHVTPWSGGRDARSLYREPTA